MITQQTTWVHCKFGYVSKQGQQILFDLKLSLSGKSKNEDKKGGPEV